MKPCNNLQLICNRMQILHMLIMQAAPPASKLTLKSKYNDRSIFSPLEDKSIVNLIICFCVALLSIFLFVLPVRTRARLTWGAQIYNFQCHRGDCRAHPKVFRLKVRNTTSLTYFNRSAPTKRSSYHKIMQPSRPPISCYFGMFLQTAR